MPKRPQPLKPKPRRCARSSTFHLFSVLQMHALLLLARSKLAGEQHARTHLCVGVGVGEWYGCGCRVCVRVCALFAAAASNDVNFYLSLLMMRSRALSLSLSRKCMDWM